MANRTDSSTNKNKSTATICTLILFYWTLNLSCGGTKYCISRKGNILDKYYSSQKYTTDKSGSFLRETERVVVDKISEKYGKSGNVIIIKEFCKPFNMTGYVYSMDNQQKTFFSRNGENSQVTFDNSSFNMDTGYYEKIIELMQRDSLKFYKGINDRQPDADDETCWLYVIRIHKAQNTYQIESTTFFHPLEFRKSIVNY